MHEAAKARPDIAKPVWHMSLRAAPEDPNLSDAQWRDIAQAHAEAMGWSSHPWVVVRHGEDHVHVVVSRVDFEGQVWSRRDDRYKAREACLQVEREYRLRRTDLEGPKQDAPRRAPSRTATTSKDRKDTAKLSQGEFRRAERTAQPPARTHVAEQVRAARAHAQRMGGGREHFEAALTEAGVQWRANVASTGRMNGYSFHAPGHNDAQGDPVWWKASDLDRSLSWGRLSKDLAPCEVVVPTPQVEPKRLMERRSSFEARQQAATVAAHQQYRDDSLNQMRHGLGRHSVAERLYWQTCSTKAANKATVWAANVQKRAVERAEFQQMMANRAKYARNPADSLKQRSTSNVDQGLSHLDRMRRDNLNPNRGRGRGPSR